MNSRFKKIIFLVAAVFAILLFTCKKQQVHIPFFSNYGNDILFIPLVCWLAEMLMKRIYGAQFELNLLYVWLTVLYTAIVFEWIVPAYTTTYTADLLDVFCYVLGGFLFIAITLPKNTFFILKGKEVAP